VGKNNNEEKLYFGVDSPTTASAVLEVVSGEEYPINLLVSATSIHDAEKGELIPYSEVEIVSFIRNT